MKKMDVERIKRMVIAALYAKDKDEQQFFLIEIADELNIPAKDWTDIKKKEKRR